MVSNPLKLQKLRESVSFNNNVVAESPLKPVAGERLPFRYTSTEEFARLDVAASGAWGGGFERSFAEARVFKPLAPSVSSLYEARVLEVEHASFASITFSAAWGCGKAAAVLMKRIASYVWPILCYVKREMTHSQ